MRAKVTWDCHGSNLWIFVFDCLNDRFPAINAAVKEKSVIDSLAVVGLVARGSTPEELAQSLREHYDRWGPLVKRIGFTADT